MAMADAEAQAEETARVLLSNGDQISGTLEHLVDGTLHLATPWAGSLKIPFSAVTRLDLTDTVRVELADGRELQGAFRLEGEKGTVGDTAFARGDLTAVNPPVIPPVVWQFSLSLGANLQQGNTEQTTAHFAVATERKTARGRFQAKAHLNRGEENGRTTASNSSLGLQYDALFLKHTFAYGKADFLEDEFRDLDLRSVLGIGLGYQVRDTDRLKFQVQGGLAYLTESFTGQDDTSELTLEAGYNLTWQIGDWGRLHELLRVRPSFDENGVQMNFETTLRTSITEAWALKLSALLDYDSEPPPGVEEEDLLFIVALEYALKP